MTHSFHMSWVTYKSTATVAWLGCGGAVGFCRLFWPVIGALRVLRFFDGILSWVVGVSAVCE